MRPLDAVFMPQSIPSKKLFFSRITTDHNNRLSTANFALSPGSSAFNAKEWSEERFNHLVSAEGDVDAAKGALYLGLEDQAACQAMLEYCTVETPLGDIKKYDFHLLASTALVRLDEIASDAVAAFYRRCSELGVTHAIEGASATDAEDSFLMTLHHDLVISYPMQLLAAINETLSSHGYHPMKQHGDFGAYHFTDVLLGTGSGSPAALAVLYIEVAERTGLTLKPCLVEGGMYVLLKPEGIQLSALGQEFVLDPYSGGALFSLKECCELFGVGTLQPTSNRHLLAALLKGLQNVYWAAATRCSPEPALMLPLNLRTALNGDYSPSLSPSSPEVFYLERALAAATKRGMLLPCSIEPLLDRAIVLYFLKDYTSCTQDLDKISEEIGGGEMLTEFKLFQQKTHAARMAQQLKARAAKVVGVFKSRVRAPN